MPQHIRNEEMRLLRRREVALARLAAINDEAAEWVAAYKAADAALGHIRTPSGQLYDDVQGKPKLAILKCLELAGKPMSSPEIADALFRGGYRMHPVRGKRLIHDSINKGTMRGWLTEGQDGRVFPTEEPK